MCAACVCKLGSQAIHSAVGIKASRGGARYGRISSNEKEREREMK